MNHKPLMIILALFALTACQNDSPVNQKADQPLDSLDLTRLAQEHKELCWKELRNSDDTFIPPGTPVAMSGVCKIARDVPVFEIRYPDDVAHEFTEKNGYFSAHLLKNPELAQMKEGQAYLVKGRIAGGETMCYGAYFIEVDSYTAIDE